MNAPGAVSNLKAPCNGSEANSRLFPAAVLTASPIGPEDTASTTFPTVASATAPTAPITGFVTRPAIGNSSMKLTVAFPIPCTAPARPSADFPRLSAGLVRSNVTLPRSDVFPPADVSFVGTSELGPTPVLPLGLPNPRSGITDLLESLVGVAAVEQLARLSVTARRSMLVGLLDQPN